MDNRFGFRDFVLVVLLVALGVMTFLAMQQDDRQFEKLKALDRKVTTQTKNMTELRTELKNELDALKSNQASDGDADGDDEPPTTQPAATQPGDGTSDASSSGSGEAGTESAGATSNAPATRNANARVASPSPTFPKPGEVDGEIAVFPEPHPRLRQARAMPSFSEGGRLIDSFSTKVEKLTPLVSQSVYAENVQDLVVERLGTLDLETLKYRGLLAQRWVMETDVPAYRDWRQEKEAKLRDKLDQSPKPESYQKRLKRLLAQAEQKPDEGTERYRRYEERAADEWIDQQIKQDKTRPTPITIHFELRPGLQFSDGRALTAEDVAFTFDWIMNPELAAARQRAYFRMVDDVTAVSRRHVKVTFAEPYFEALQLAASMPVLPKHYYADMNPRDYNTSKARLLGSGPYELRDLEAWRPGDPIVLERNQRYWGLRTGFDQIVYLQITNSTAELTTFRNGDLDMFSPEPEQFEALLEDEPLVAKTRNYAYMTPYTGYRFIGWNQRTLDGEQTRFADKRVRQAMTMLIDREAILERVLLGHGRIAGGPFNPLGDQPAPGLDRWPHDVSRARALLKDAGYWDRDDDGTIEDASGRPFRFDFTYPAGSPSYKKMAFFLQNAFAQAGIIMNLNPLEFNVLIQRLVRKNFDAITLGWSSGPETDIYQMFHSNQIIAGGDNSISYRNPRLDRLMERARTTMDRQKRMELWHECHRILHEDQPYTFLFWGKSLRFVDKRIHNTRVTRSGMVPPINWFVPDSLQQEQFQ